MPRYSVQLANGKTLVLEGDTQPSDADFEAAAKEAGVQLLQAQPSTADNIRNVLKMPFNVLSTMPGMPQGLRDAIRTAPEYPVTTLAAAALPGAVGAVGRTAAPFVGPGLRAAGSFLEQPLVGGGVGALEGYQQGGPSGAVKGAVYGSLGGTVLGKGMKALASHFEPPPPNPNAGGRLNIPTQPEWDPAALRRANTTITPNSPVGRGIQEGLQESMPRPTSVTLAPSHPSGGGFTQPPASPHLGMGGRLVPRSSPTAQQTAQQVLNSTLQQPSGVTVPRTFPSGGGFTVPPEIPTAPGRYTLSPAAQRAAAGKAPMTGPAEGTQIEQLLRSLARKPILSPAEAQQLQTLQHIAKQRASSVGMSFASGGKTGIP